MSRLSDYKTVFVSTRQSPGEAETLQKAPATAIPVSPDESDHGCWSWDRLIWRGQEILTAAIDNARGDVSDRHAVFFPFGKEVYHEGDKGQSKMLNGKPVARSMAITRWTWKRLKVIWSKGSS